jgi:hypothetical protein
VELPEELLAERYCTLSTEGRNPGRRPTAQLWFVPAPGGIYLMSGSGGLTQWCLNLEHQEQGVVRIDGRSWLARGALLHRDDPDRAAALDAFHDRYDREGKDRREPWLRHASVAHLVFTREL